MPGDTLRQRAFGVDQELQGELELREAEEHRVPPGIGGQLGRFRSKAIDLGLHGRDRTHHLKFQGRPVPREFNLVQPRAERCPETLLHVPPRLHRPPIHAAANDLHIIVQPPPLMGIPRDPEPCADLML